MSTYPLFEEELKSITQQRTAYGTYINNIRIHMAYIDDGIAYRRTKSFVDLSRELHDTYEKNRLIYNSLLEKERKMLDYKERIIAKENMVRTLELANQGDQEAEKYLQYYTEKYKSL